MAYPDSLVHRQPKRRGVALSCAECRRLKLKCSRAFPCNNCVKKGCAAICPDGSLTTGKGNRFVLANTEVLHEKISALANRVRHLEDALAASHALTSLTPHPLLAEDLLQIKRPLERERLDGPQPQDKEDPGDPIDSLGSLSISQRGTRSTFFGQTANSWYLLQNEQGSEDEPDDPDPHQSHETHSPLASNPTLSSSSSLPYPHTLSNSPNPFRAAGLPAVVDIPWSSHAFPFASITHPQSADQVRSAIFSKLPSPDQARSLADIYYRHAAWMYTPISESDFYENIFRPVYNAHHPLPHHNHHTGSGSNSTHAPSPSSSQSQSESPSSPPSALPTATQGTYTYPSLPTISAHNLSSLCTILAIGSLLDLSKPAQSHSNINSSTSNSTSVSSSHTHSQPHPTSEAHTYYHLARSALSIQNVLEEQTIQAIQALLLMCHFMFLAEMGAPRWVIMGMVVKLAQSVGLHRDSGKWKLDPEQTQKRRELFYELLTYDSWQIDAQFPHEPTKTEDGDMEMTFATWKHRFSAQCLSVVHDQAFGARTPNYKTIRDLDKKVRTWYIPPSLQVPGFGTAPLNHGLGSSSGLNLKSEGGVEQPTVELTMQRYTAFAIKEMTLFYMHRGFFAQALEDNPSDPMGSKYSPSVLAAYGSATSFVGLIESLFNQHPALTERMWFLFTHVFSCAIVLGSIAAKSQMGLARSALSHLESAYNLFSRVSDTAKTGKILPILQKLRDRARAAQTAGNTGTTPHLHLTISNSPSSSSASASGGASGAGSSPYGVTSSTSTPPSRTLGIGGGSGEGGVTIKDEYDPELSALGGMTRLVSRRRSSGSPSLQAPSPGPGPSSATGGGLSVHGQGHAPMGMAMSVSVGGIPSSSSSSSQHYHHQRHHQMRRTSSSLSMSASSGGGGGGGGRSGAGAGSSTSTPTSMGGQDLGMYGGGGMGVGGLTLDQVWGGFGFEAGTPTPEPQPMPVDVFGNNAAGAGGTAFAGPSQLNNTGTTSTGGRFGNQYHHLGHPMMLDAQSTPSPSNSGGGGGGSGSGASGNDAFYAPFNSGMNAFGVGHGQHHQAHHLHPQQQQHHGYGPMPTANDLHDSWQNFMAQYK